MSLWQEMAHSHPDGKRRGKGSILSTEMRFLGWYPRRVSFKDDSPRASTKTGFLRLKNLQLSPTNRLDSGPGEMAQQAKALAVKPDDLDA